MYRLQGAGEHNALLCVGLSSRRTTFKMELFSHPVLENAFMEVGEDEQQHPNAYQEAILKAFLHGEYSCTLYIFMFLYFLMVALKDK